MDFPILQIMPIALSDLLILGNESRIGDELKKYFLDGTPDEMEKKMNNAMIIAGTLNGFGGIKDRRVSNFKVLYAVQGIIGEQCYVLYAVQGIIDENF